MEERPCVASAGLVFVVAWIIGLIIAPSSPSLIASATEVSNYFIHNRGAAMLQTYILDGIAGVSILIFSAALRDAFRRFEGKGAALSDVIFGAGVAAASVSLVQAALGETLASIGK